MYCHMLHTWVVLYAVTVPVHSDYKGDGHGHDVHAVQWCTSIHIVQGLYQILGRSRLMI